MHDFKPTARTRVRRLPQRAVYDRAQIYEMLDEGYVCHAGFVVEGHPVVIPKNYGREGDRLYIHGAPAGRLMRAVREGLELCIAVTLVDGLVLARSASHHSLNYRSVVMYGKGIAVTGAEEKRTALRVITNHLLPNRWEQVRPPDERELKATAVIAFPLEELSAKVRTGPPIDDEADLAIPVWAGVIPVPGFRAR